MSEPIVRVLDNPILIAQARRRLRRTQLISSSLVFGLLGLCGLLLAWSSSSQKDGFATLEYVLVVGIALLLLLRGSNRVAEAVREERVSGLLDFHRATPMTPWTAALGYVLGCPAREYLAAGLLATFALIAAPFSRFSVTAVLASLLILFVNGLLYHCFALWVGLTMNHKRGASGIIIGTLVVVLLTGFGSEDLGAISYLTPYPAIMALLANPDRTLPAVSFYSVPIHPLWLSLLVQGSVLFGLSHAASRKLRQEESLSFSRLGTLYLFGWMAFLSLGAVWQYLLPATDLVAPSISRQMDFALVVGYLAVGTALAAALVIGQVPSYLMVLRALRRARRQGMQQLSWLQEGGRTEPLTLGLWAMLVAGLLVIHRAMASKVQATLLGEPMMWTLLSTLLYLLFVQLASEFVRLRHRGSTHAVAVLVFFVSHVLPWLLSFAFSGFDSKPGIMIMAVSPAFSVAQSALYLSDTWFARTRSMESLGTLRFSLSVSIPITLAACAYFYSEVRRCRRDLAAKLDASSP
jgi:hypothetical protein